MLNCNEVNEMISLYIDEELDEKKCSEFEEHIDSCGSCRLQLEEMTRLVLACRDLEEVELPEGFAEELHMKLASVNQKDKVKSGLLYFPFNKAKVFSAIAAVFVMVSAVAFLARSTILTPSKTASPSKGLMIAGRSAADSAAQKDAKAKTGAEANNSSVNSAADGNGKAYLTEDTAGTYAGTASKQEETANMESADQMNIAAADSTRTQGISTSRAVADTGSGKLVANIQIFSTDVNTLAKEIDKIVLASQGEKADQETASISTTTTFTASRQPDEIVVEYKILNVKYNDFVNSLIATYGQTGLVAEKPVLQDLSEDLNSLNKQAEELDANIKKAEKGEISLSKDELLRLQDEKKLLDRKISDIKSQMEYTFVTVEMKKK